ncbi:MAG TPA: DUF4160 domain-containing protein [Candidatus Peribacteraceae bacterium]|nr:DUF4160 domain-containing protein [Candidatus Peribacteraceae bacterium]
MLTSASAKEGLTMPLISSFYGILIYMYWLDTKRHHSPHIHAEYAGSEAVFSIAESELLEGSMPPRQIRLIQAWIEIHREELMADWTLAIRGETLVKIDPLR